MFSPWTAGIVNFWIEMSFSAIVLTSLVLTFSPDVKGLLREGKPAGQISAGIMIAVILWGVFWLGDFLSSRMFDFAPQQVGDVYSMKEGTAPWLVAVLLLLLIGPAEELFWRGYVQRTLTGLCGGDKAFILTTAVYALVHIWSFNFMLVMAALVAGAVWGFLYRLRPSLLPALIVSHAVWDALVFIILPIR